MNIPNMKRIKISTESDLVSWLSKNASTAEQVMFVTCGKASPNKHIKGARVRELLEDNGWLAGQSFTLIGNLQGHVAIPN